MQLTPDEWTDRARCRDYHDPDAFFVEASSTDKEGLSRPRMLEALELCSRCEVRKECLTTACRGLRSPIDGVQARIEGIWGGTTTRDRRAARKQAPGDLEAQVAILERELPKRIARRRKAVKGKPRPCLTCGKELPPQRTKARKYCSAPCRPSSQG